MVEKGGKEFRGHFSARENFSSFREGMSGGAFGIPTWQEIGLFLGRWYITSTHLTSLQGEMPDQVGHDGRFAWE